MRHQVVLLADRSRASAEFPRSKSSKNVHQKKENNQSF